MKTTPLLTAALLLLTALPAAQAAEAPQTFLLPVEDVFSVGGRTIVAGRIDRGAIKVGDRLEIVGGAEVKTTTCGGIEMFRKQLDAAQAGDNVGMILKGVEKADLKPGMVVAAPGTIKTATTFKAKLYLLAKEEGGRHTPVFSQYRPLVQLWGAAVAAKLTLPEGLDLMMPGDDAEVTFSLVVAAPLEIGRRFTLKEGGRIIGALTVLEILSP